MNKSSSIFAAALLGAALFAGSVARADEPVAEVPVPDHIVYLAKLPAAAELSAAAAKRGTTIERIDQTADRLTVVYAHSGGKQTVWAYVLLSAIPAGSPEIVSQPGPAPTTTTIVQQSVPAREVVYVEQAPRVYYETRYVRTYDPAWDWFAPLAVGVGLGWVWHGGGGHYHGGHGWHH